MKNKKELKNLFNYESSSYSFLIKFLHLIYISFGRRFLRNKKFKAFFYKNIYNPKYDILLKKANLKILPEEYFFSIYFLIFSLFVLIFIASFFSLFYNLIYSAISFYFIGIIVVTFIGIFLYNLPFAIGKQRGKEIDASMIYLLPYMKILSKELNLSKMVDIIEEFLIYKEIKEEFRRIKYFSNFLGYDIHSSIKEAMNYSPSNQLSDLMNDLVTISNSGGDIYMYLDRKLYNLNQEIEAQEKKNIETLLIYSQIYVVLLLVSPLFYTIMTSILSLISFNINGSAPASDSTSVVVSIVLLLLILPFAYGLFMMLIYFSKPLYSRLSPIKDSRLISDGGNL
jgi:archaellum biogenesis protein FlaJ (TadC family)